MFKKGAASFYVVAFSTLVLVIIAMSFAAVIISEITRTSNDDLSQSAYDSALAGIEDAKLAFYNYQACKEQGAVATIPDGAAPLTCGEIIWFMENPNCDMVAHILGRIGELESSEASGGVMIQETESGDNSMQQAYTCAKITTTLHDYRSTLTEENATRVVRVRLTEVAAQDIKKVKISWYSKSDGSNNLAFTNVSSDGARVRFPALKDGESAATPPTISVGLVQTADAFNLSDFEKATATATDRATIYLVPTGNKTMAKGKNEPDNYTGAYNGTENYLTQSQVAKSNNRSVKNLPFAVYCSANLDNGFACSATMELPDAINGARSNETFMIVVSMPYGQPSTDFALEFFCGDGQSCGTLADGGAAVDQPAVLNGVQVDIDSTGRANNLYRRVEARLDTADSYFPYPLYAIELLNDKTSGNLLDKATSITAEWSKSTYAANLNSLLTQ